MRFPRAFSCFILLGAWLAASCRHSPWPDEPGLRVDISRSSNIDSEASFLTALANRRRTTQRPEPIISPRYQSEIRVFAEDLQTGRLTVGGVELAVAAWARSVYHTDVEVFMLDCSAGRAMPLPERLSEMPVVVIAYAAAHFRPRSVASAQCAILTAVVVGSATVEQERF